MPDDLLSTLSGMAGKPPDHKAWAADLKQQSLAQKCPKCGASPPAPIVYGPIHTASRDALTAIFGEGGYGNCGHRF